jgi:SAM-dependent methyltransferase
VLTEKIVEGASFVAVDAGPDMVAAARARGLDARVMDGQKLTFSAEFEAVFSNAALHWTRDQEAVLAGVHRALRPRGRRGDGRPQQQRRNHRCIELGPRPPQAQRALVQLGRGTMAISSTQNPALSSFLRYASAVAKYHEGFTNRPRSLAGHLCRRFSRCRDGA